MINLKKITSGQVNIYTCWMYYSIYVHSAQLTQFLETLLIWLNRNLNDSILTLLPCKKQGVTSCFSIILGIVSCSVHRRRC